MFYPTYQSKKDQTVHIVKDQNQCLCGLKHNSFYELNRQDLRNIVFKQLDEVTCETCLKKVEKMQE
ncbi:hypothetical protein [Peribacillus glennii]|uniref:Uncharacterized protein n=1 Tax=Peribacillus glennii TaxID=2303991 RepID=A0A372LE53_9BACI|nr:hypothetical protein [Peribacillus glennii]RFU63936.1 hypothetical protein D0466_10835 [Peribacillus glennii]